MLRLLTTIALTVLLTYSCRVNTNYPVEYDYNYKSDFREYNSFAFWKFENGLDSTADKLVIRACLKSHRYLKYDWAK